MHPLLRLVLVVWAAVLVGTGLSAGGAVGVDVAADAAAPVDLRPSAAHPYSDPTWFPLRAPATVGCARTGCGTSSDHGYDAIDLLGHLGDPVYAAGAGVAHLGGDAAGCSSSGEVEGGRWVWVDHGGGVTSRYRHLDTITVTDGQLVTPATRLGTMGHSGDVSPCTTTYLHFEVRHGGFNGERVDFGALRGCGAQGPVLLPQVLGFDSWDDPGLHPQKRLVTPALDSSCVAADWLSTAPVPTPVTARVPGGVQVSLVPPPEASTWVVDLQIWRPTLQAWTTLTLATLPSSTPGTTLTAGVEDDRRYRVRVAVHQGEGWSDWSGPTEVVAPPGAPGLRYLQWKRPSSTKRYLHYGWSRPDSFGSTVTGYAVSRRCGASADALGSWKTVRLKGSATYTNLRRLGRARVCEVRIQASNAAGSGPWSVPEAVSR